MNLGAMLIVEKGIDDFSVIPLDEAETLLGRSPEADVVIHSPYVSHEHARIARKGELFYVEDAGSKNGTFVNGSLLPEGSHRLHTKDKVELAPAEVVLIFHEYGTTLTLPAGRRGASDLIVDGKSRDVWIQGMRLEPPLSPLEFEVLELLYMHRGEACPRDTIAERCWPNREAGDVSNQEIDQCIRRLRVRIEPDPSSPSHIVVRRKIGYILVSADA